MQFHSYEEAQDLYELASDYQVEELVKKCHDYMLQGRLTLLNIFSKYEHALKIQFDVLLNDCRNFVCINAEAVFESKEFLKTSHEIVEDIIKLDNLSLATELQVIKAVLNWGAESLKRNEIPDNEKNLRNIINPFLKHLRILSLTPEEFQNLVKEYDIFSSYESTVLFQRIMIPEFNNRLPKNFCSITSKRGAANLSHRTSFEPNLYDLGQSASFNSIPSNSQKSVKSLSPKLLQPDPPMSVWSDLPKSRQTDNNKLSYEVSKYSPKSTNVPSGSKQKFNSSPNILDIRFPPPNFSQNLRDFIFPLKESEKSFKLSFRKDIKCSVIMTLKSGNLAFHGFEMKVKRSEKKEKLELSVDLQGFSKQRFEKSYNMELQNNVYLVRFPQPMKLLEGCKGKLEVCIDDLFLDRCYQVGKKDYELNCGLNFECEFSIDSNNKTNDGEQLVFLINKLIYMPC